LTLPRAAKLSEPKTSAHDLRHSFVSYLILELGLDPHRVARIVGHARASFTMDTYAHLFEQATHAEPLRQRMAESALGSVI
jgi:integrase